MSIMKAAAMVVVISVGMSGCVIAIGKNINPTMNPKVTNPKVQLDYNSKGKDDSKGNSEAGGGDKPDSAAAGDDSKGNSEAGGGDKLDGAAGK